MTKLHKGKNQNYISIHLFLMLRGKMYTQSKTKRSIEIVRTVPVSLLQSHLKCIPG